MTDEIMRRLDWTYPPPPLEHRELLEVLPDEPDEGRPPLLFVHGAYHGAWAWREHWMPAAAERGWRTYAVSLRGHGGSDGRDRLGRTTLRHYEHDVLQAIIRLPEPPVLVGHSMGGLVCQRVAARYPARALVLVASVPPDHGLDTLASMARHQPLAALRGLVGLQARPDPTLLFHDDEPARRYGDRLGNESPLAAYQLILPHRPHDTDAPVLVLGGGEDLTVPPHATVRTARHYGTRAHLFRGMGHDLMLDTGWQAPLERMLAWLDEVR